MPAEKPVILLVDDDEDFLDVTRLALVSGGCDVLACRDPAEAMAVLADHEVDVVVTDLMMSTLDSGFKFVNKLRKDEKLSRIPVILATSAAKGGLDFHPHGEKDLAAMGVDAFFDKPLPAAALLKEIARLLKR
jgi:CheY-like chemotaxis protein